jgi:hypothetical protein
MWKAVGGLASAAQQASEAAAMAQKAVSTHTRAHIQLVLIVADCDADAYR